MQYTRKMVLVPEHTLQRLEEQITVRHYKTKSRSDEMEQVWSTSV